MKLTNRHKAYILLLINTAIWGASPVIVKDAYEFTTPFRFLFMRFAVAGFLVLPLLIDFYLQLKDRFWKYLPKIISIELIGTSLNLSLLYVGLQYTTSIEAGLIATTAPVFTTIAGVIFLKEKEGRNELIGLMIAIIGSILITLVPLFRNKEISFSLLGSFLIFLQNITAAGYMVLAKKHYKKVPKFMATGVSFWVGMISFFIISLIASGNVTALSTDLNADIEHLSVLFAVFFMAILGSIIGYTALIKGQDLIEVSEASMFIYLQPLFFIPSALMMLGEQLHWLQVVALIIVLFGVFIANKRGTTKHNTNRQKASKHKY